MIEIKLNFDKADYDTIIPVVAELFIKNPIARKGAILALKTKIKNKTQSERDAILVNFINEHKNKILEGANKKATEAGMVGYLCNIDASIL